MGYRTYFTLMVTSEREELIEELRKECEGAEYALEEEGNPQQDCKWDEHETDMQAFSAKHPEVLFTLNGEGEESTDLWNKYFKGGKMQACYAQITFEEYDETKLS